MFYVYALRLSDGSLYIGYTSDLESRYKQHKLGNVNSTAHKQPSELIYLEGCKNKYDAIHREKYLKSGPGRRYLTKRLKIFFIEALAR